MNPDLSLKLRWVIVVVLGLHLMAPPVLADTSRVTDYFSTNSLLNEDEFVFESAGDEPLSGRKQNLFLSSKRKTERSSLRGKIKLDSNYFKGIFTDTGYALTSPWRWDSFDWATASIVAGVTGVFFVLDDEIKDEVQNSRSSTTDDLSEIFEPFGNGAVTIPVLAGLYLYGRFGENDKIERTALLATESFLVRDCSLRF